MLDQPTGAIIAALIAFVGGQVVARITSRQKEDELFYKALDFLGGGSQERNVGISAIELYWRNPRHRPISVSLLIGSALYLLLASKQKDKAHELHNLDRIMALLLRDDAFSASSREQYSALLSAVSEARNPNRDGGLTVDEGKLRKWEQKLTRRVPPA